MTIKVKLFATLAAQLAGSFPEQYPRGLKAGSPVIVELPPGSRVADLLDRLPIDPKYVFTAFVNGRSRERHQALMEGDEVGLFPPIAGG